MLFQKELKILVAPLDWGLGHTTRCIPIAQELIDRNVTVIFAGNKMQRKVLQTEFLDCRFLPLEGYHIQYTEKGKRLPLKMLAQIPRIFKTIMQEHKWLKGVLNEHQIDGVISDNRFGLYNTAIPTVFITHQLQIKNNLGGLFTSVLQRLNYSRINKYSQCWIPDLPGGLTDFEKRFNLAGDLSHPSIMPRIPCSYIGPLTRMKPAVAEQKKNHLLIVISGPEPQRSIFEEIIFKQLISFNGTATVVRGLPGTAIVKTASSAAIKVYNHLSKTDMNREMVQAEFVICRSGYSTIMDINAVGAKAILVPTPGQTEQEYLYRYLMRNSFAPGCEQHLFDMNKMLALAKKFPYTGFIKPEPGLLQNAVYGFLERCAGRII